MANLVPSDPCESSASGQRTLNELLWEELLKFKAERNRLILEQLIGKLSEPKCVDWLKFGGLISMSIDLNLKQRCGVNLTKSEQKTLETCRAKSRILYWLFVIFAVCQFLLIIIRNDNIQLLLGDMTGFWPFMLSIHSAVILDLFNKNESKLYWYLPFMSLKLFRVKSDPLLIDHGNSAISDRSAFYRRLSTLHSYTFFTACFLNGLFCFNVIVTACFNYHKNGIYTPVFALLWYVLELF